MKKILIASTALVGTASVAAAEVTLSGYGRFGIQYDENRGTDAAPEEETRLESRWRLNIDGVTETDGGIRFAARVRVQADEESDGSVGTGEINSPRYQVSFGGFRVRVGNISGVTDASDVVNYFGIEPGLVGKTGQYATFGGGVLGAFDAYSSTGQGPTGINVKYEAGDFAVMASWTDDFDADEKDGGLGVGDRTTWEIGASYTFGDWTIGGVYGEGDFGSTGAPDPAVEDYDWWVLTATGAIGPADVVFFLGETDVDVVGLYEDDLAYGISGSFPVGASTDITASVAGGGEDSLDTAYGIGFVHDLGAGVSLKGMAGRDAFDNNIADLGVIFNF
ncbi:MAG: porin [Pseudomonadota bacterium]